MPLDKKYKSIIEAGILLGSAIFLAVFIALSMANFLGNSSMPNVAVSTTSMMPIYRGFQDGSEQSGTLYPFRGDILLIRKVPAHSLEVGDVIVFNTPSVSDPVVHRIVASWQNGSNYYFFKTNGDNNVPPDNWTVGEKDVIGMVVIRIPHIGWFLLTLQTTLGKILILTLTVLVLFGEEIFQYIGLSSNDKEKEGSITSTNNHEVDTSKMKSKSKSTGSIFRKKESIYVILGIIILITFAMSNILATVSHSPSIDCFTLNDTSGNLSLLESSEVSMRTLVSRYKLVDTESETSYFYPILIKLRSGGIFNNIDYFEIRVNQSKGLYKWTIVNNYIGIHTIKGGIISSINGSVEISIRLHSRGLLASSPLTYTFPIFLQG
ncbi:MAG: signal peptidase I [Candidatus Hodarchaeales archaeon]